MSTRSIIVVIGASDSRGKKLRAFRMYKHCDGYPEGALPVIAAALKQGADFIFRDGEPTLAAAVVGLLIGAGTDEGGMGVVVDRDENGDEASFDVTDGLGPRQVRRVYGEQPDLEFIYTIDMVRREVLIAGGGYDGRPAFTKYKELTPRDKLAAGEPARARVREFIRSIRLSGFRVNGGPESA
jgi:hypothetical protein